MTCKEFQETSDFLLPTISAFPSLEGTTASPRFQLPSLPLSNSQPTFSANLSSVFPLSLSLRTSIHENNSSVVLVDNGPSCTMVATGPSSVVANQQRLARGISLSCFPFPTLLILPLYALHPPLLKLLSLFLTH